MAVLNRPKFKDSVPDALPSFRVGEPLSRQPVIQIFGGNGNPVKGATVTAFAWHSPYYRYDHYESGKLTAFSKAAIPFAGHRFATFANAISVPSNEEGLARFANLTITGTSDAVVYLHFYCQGKLAAWSAPQTVQQETRNPVFNLPLMIQWPNSVEHTVKMNVPMPLSVVEGKPLDIFSIVVKPAVAGKLVFATIQQRSDDRLHPFYYNGPTGIPESGQKRLMHAVATTDDQGVAAFDSLTFQKTGNSGRLHSLSRLKNFNRIIIHHSHFF